MSDHPPRIGVVEDDDEIAGLLCALLEAEGLAVSRAADAREADAMLAGGGIDLVLLDVMLPGEDGLSICRRVRAAGGPPVIMVSALGSESERVAGLDAGADDYVAKPFGRHETLARIRAVLRRATGGRGAPASERLAFGEWVLDVQARTLRDGHGVRMATSGAEFDLLLAFLRRPGQVLSRAALLTLTHAGAAGPDERTVDVHISRLRQKIEADPRDPALIKTVRLGGYVFAGEVGAA